MDQLSPAAQAQAFWQEAKKIRLEIVRDIGKLEQGTSSKNEDQMKTLEENIAQFRLRFVYILSQAPHYIYEQDAENVMWQLHVYINRAYRELLHKRLRGQHNVVAKRKVEKLYTSYLKTAQGFYMGYFQRLQSLHGMPQIPRINSVLKLEGPEIDERQSQLVPATSLQKSFQSTLLHLGDLSRWRHQARPKSDGSKMALLYYDLAHDLKPTSGDAHHQMGMIYTEEKNHLLVVYYLYRSLAVEVPHGAAMRNLETEFKQLLQASAPSRRTGPPDPNEAFSNWFVRLHARFYKGEEFSSQAELEETVIHHLESMLKKPGTMPVVLKMVLINIAAYYVAKSRVDKTWTLDASNSCQFILSFNVRWILVLSRLLQSELQEFSKAAAPTEDETQDVIDGDNNQAHGAFSPFTENILPLMRLYMAWLYFYRADIVKYQAHLGGHVIDLYRTLAQALTTLTKEFKGQQMAASPYLLPEDIVALGMKPFDDPKLAAACRIHLALEKDTFKPHWEDRGLPRNEPVLETRARVYDLMNSGFSLSLDDDFPLSTTLPVQGSDGSITISYMDGGKAPKRNLDTHIGCELAQTPDRVQQLDGQFHDPPTLGRFQSPKSSSVDNPRSISTPAIGNHGHGHIGEVFASATKADSPEHNHANRTDSLDTEQDQSLDAQMHTMVDNLLDDDDLDITTADPGYGLAHPERSCYGKHSTTAEQAFGERQTPGRVAVAVPAFGQANPWGPFATSLEAGASRTELTTPQYDKRGHLDCGSANNGQRTSSTSFLKPTVSNSYAGSRLQSDPELSASLPRSNFHIPDTQLGHQIGQIGQIGLGYSGRPPSGLAGTLRGVHGNLGHTRQQFGGSTGSDVTSPFFSPKENIGSYEIASGTQNAGQANSLEKTSSPPLGLSLCNNPFSIAFPQTTFGSRPTSSSLGLPGGQPNVAFKQDEVYSYRQQSAKAVPPYPQLYNMATVCNGNVYNATTAYGRGVIATKDDPTHFRNAVKTTHMAKAVSEADAFDRAILESALVDDGPKPKR